MKRREFLEWLGSLVVGVTSISLLNQLFEYSIPEAERFKEELRLSV